MSNNFLSDISNEIIQLLELEDYDGIYDTINDEIIAIENLTDATGKKKKKKKKKKTRENYKSSKRHISIK